MASRKPSLWRLMLVVLVVVTGLALVAGGGAGFVLHPKSAQAGADAQLISIALGVLALGSVVIGMFRWSLRSSRAAPTGPIRERVAEARIRLGDELQTQWEKERDIRQLHDPDALTVYWKLSELPVMDHVQNIFRPDHLTSNEVGFSGQTDEIGVTAMAAWFRNLVKRRLVILGDAGMGKTTLAMLLMLELLTSPERDRLDAAEGERVPVLLTLSGWHPGIDLREWLGQRLGETYPVLRAYGPDVPGELVNRGKILPVLDGLDELASELRPRLLDQVRAHPDPLILTCRTAEYLATVTGPGGKPLTGAAVIEPMPLQADKIAAYLERLPCQRRSEWPYLFDTLTSHPDHPITRALITPLNVWLLRKTYIDTGEDPTGLLDTGRYRTQYAITHHLLDGLVRALFAARPPSADSEDPFVPRHFWKPADASRWLAFLAQHVQAGDGQDLAWWHLNHSLATCRQSFIATVVSKTGPTYGLVYGLGLALLILLPNYVAGVHGPSLVRTIILLLFFGVAGAMLGLVGRARKSSIRSAGNFIDAVTNLETVPSYANFRSPFGGDTRSWLSPGLAILRSALLLGLLLGLCGGVIGASGGAFLWWERSHLPHHPAGPAAWIVFGLAVGFGSWLVGGFLSMSMNFLRVFATTPLTGDQPQTPAITLHRDLQLTSIIWLMVGLPFVLAAAPMVALIALAYGLRGAIVVGVFFTLLPAGWGLVWVVDRASVGYLVTVRILRIDGLVPRRLMAFLDDAHRVGLLRQVGVMYQFRHITLTDYFAPPSPQNLIARHTSTGDPVAAIAALEELLTDQLRLLGPDHHDTLTTRYNLALWRTEAGDPAAAIAALEELADRFRVLSAYPVETLTTRQQIAVLQAEAGDPAAAITALKELLTDQLRLLGPDHHDTLSTRYDIAGMMAERGDHAAALAEFRDLLADQLRLLGPDHPSTLAASSWVDYLEAQENT